MIFSLLIYPLLALEVLVQGPNTSDIEFEKHLLQKPQVQSYSSFAQKAPPQAEKRVQSLLKKAQFEFLQGSMDKAIQLFKEIADQEHEHHWSKDLQEVIHYSQLRLSQLSQEEKDKKGWMRKALLYNSHIPIDKKLFPPPMVSQYQKMKKEDPLQVWSLPTLANEFQQILINGQPQDRDSSFVRHRAGIVKISFFSNQYQATHMTTDIAHINQAKLSLLPLAEGSCHNPQWNIQTPESVKLKIIESSCSPHSQAKKLTRSQEWSQPSPTPTLHKSSKAFYKSKWFWIGVSVVATGLTWHLISQNNKNNPSPQAPQPPSAPRDYEFTN